jgi:hypothetical protein
MRVEQPDKPDAVNPAMTLGFAIADQWRRAADLQRFGRTMKALVTLFVGLLLAGCSKSPSMQDIRTYGEQKFINDVLAVAEGKPVPNALLTTFRPLRVEPHLGGAWLVYRDSGRHQAGIYVDRTSVDGWGGSGMEITRWSDRIGWSEEKVRR